MPRKHKNKTSKKNKTATQNNAEEQLKKYPHSLVIQRGNVGKKIADLVKDVRRVMEPFTATSLKVRRRNVLRDFVNVAGPLNITHFLTFTKTKVGNYMHVMRLPRGPTLTFKIDSYCLSRDIVSYLKRHSMDHKQFQNPPLLVLNGFTGEGMHIKLMTTMFQNMFASINVNKIKLSNVRRCVLLTYNQEGDSLEFRHYSIKTVPVGMSKSVKKLVKAQVPNMSRYEDISEYLLRAGDLSESEAEMDGPHNQVVLPQTMSARGNIKAAKSAIRLTEIGPRLSLQLVKIQDGLCDGEIIYHSFMEKTEEEKKELASKRHKKKKAKEQRKQQQEENIKKKEEKKEFFKKKCMDGMKKDDDKNEDFEEVDPEAAATTTPSNLFNKEEDSDDDIAYYRAEVGEEPEPELFPKTQGHKRKHQKSHGHNVHPKRMKKTDKTETGSKEDRPNRKKTKVTEMDNILRRKKAKKQRVNLKMKQRGLKKKMTSARPRKR